MSSATQIYYAAFDTAFLKLPPALRARIENQIDDIGSRLGSYPHHRLKGSNRYRARVGDYRIIYTFEWRRTECICWPSDTDAKFTANSKAAKVEGRSAARGCRPCFFLRNPAIQPSQPAGRNSARPSSQSDP